MIKKSLILGLTVFLCVGSFSGCGLWPKKEERKYVIKYPPELDAVNQMIIEKKTDDAKMKIDDYLNRSENIHWFGHAYFLKAFLYEMDGKYPEAIKGYRSAIQHSASYNSRVEAKALYNLSFVYERIENMPKLTTTLLDLMKRRKYFDLLTGQVEIPARLGATYAYLGKMKEAKIFHREAANNFNRVVRKNHFNATKSEISKSLYYLGFAIYSNNKDSFSSVVQKVSSGQKYFLASAEASRGEWAEKSTNQLLDNYDRIWMMIKKYEATGFDKDQLAKKRQTHMRQLEMAADLYDLMHRLKAEEFPMSNVNRRSKAIMEKANEWLRKIEAFAQSLELGPELIRSKPVKQRRLMRYIEKPKEPVRINKESTQTMEKNNKSNNSKSRSKSLPEKKAKDPNL